MLEHVVGELLEGRQTCESGKQLKCKRACFNWKAALSNKTVICLQKRRTEGMKVAIISILKWTYMLFVSFD